MTIKTQDFYPELFFLINILDLQQGGKKTTLAPNKLFYSFW